MRTLAHLSDLHLGEHEGREVRAGRWVQAREALTAGWWDRFVRTAIPILPRTEN